MRVTRNFKDTHDANTVLGDNFGNILRECPEFVIEIKTLNIVSYDQIAGNFPRLTHGSDSPLLLRPVRPNEV